MHHRLCRSGQATSMFRPSCNFFTADNMPLWQSWRTHTLRMSHTTARLISERNHNQLSTFSDSTKAKARGTTLPSASTPIQVSIHHLYIPVKNVPSTQNWSAVFESCNHSPKGPEGMLKYPVTICILVVININNSSWVPTLQQC